MKRRVWRLLYAYLVLSTGWHIGTARSPIHATWVWAWSWVTLIALGVLAFPILLVAIIEVHHLWRHHRPATWTELRDDATAICLTWWRETRRKNEGTT